MHRWVLAAGLLAISAFGSAQKGQKVIIVSWDGAADWVVDKLLAENKLPNLAKMASQGAAAEYMLASYPSKTAVGHASIWTGTWPDVHGVTGNSVPMLPKSERNFLQSQSGFSSAALRAEPIYVTAAKQGKKVAVLSGTQGYPAAPHLESLGTAAKNYVSFSGFETELAKAAMHDFGAKIVPVEAWTDLPRGNGPYREIVIRVADTPIYVLAYNDPKDPVGGYDTLLIRPLSRQLNIAKTQTIIKPKPATSEDDKAWSKPMKVTRGDLYGYVSFRLFNLDTDLEKVQLYQSKVSMVRGSGAPAETAKYAEAYGGFHDDPFWNYQDGLFGKTLWQGGTGEAEARVVEVVRHDIENLKRSLRFALKQWKPDLITHYQPMTDSAGHTWMGVLDRDSPAYNATMAAKIWPHYERIFQLEDEWLGDIMAAAPDYNILLVSDHGMEGTNRTFYPNAVLEQAGLLKRTFGNAVEPAQTKIAAPPYGDFFLVINGSDWKQGIVLPEQRARILEEATNWLRSARDPDTGQLIVRNVYRPEDMPALGLGGPAGGDLYLELAPGYYPSNRISDRIVSRTNSPIGDGVHGFLPTRRKMHAIFYAYGQGVKAGPIPAMQQIDVAPTAATLLGITPPSTYRGRVLPIGK